MEDYMTPEEVRQFLRLKKVDTVYAMIRRGDLPGTIRFRVGGGRPRWRIPRQSVLAGCELWQAQPAAGPALPVTDEELRKRCPKLVELGLL